MRRLGSLLGARTLGCGRHDGHMRGYRVSSGEKWQSRARAPAASWRIWVRHALWQVHEHIGMSMTVPVEDTRYANMSTRSRSQARDHTNSGLAASRAPRRFDASRSSGPYSSCQFTCASHIGEGRRSCMWCRRRLLFLRMHVFCCSAMRFVFAFCFFHRRDERRHCDHCAAAEASRRADLMNVSACMRSKDVSTAC